MSDEAREEAIFRAGWQRGRKYAIDPNEDAIDDEWSAKALDNHVIAWRKARREVDAALLDTCRRIDIKAILADPVQRRELMVQTIIATQAREGITTTREQAEAAYDKVQKEKRP